MAIIRKTSREEISIDEDVNEEPLCTIGGNVNWWLLLLILSKKKSLQPCPTLCDPVDGSPPGSPVPGILQARTLEWVAISFSNAWKWKVESEVPQSCPTLTDPMDCSPPGSSIHEILQARTLEWVAIAFSKLVAATIKNNREILQVKNYHLFQQFHFCVYIQKKWKLGYRRDICTAIFNVPLFTIAKIWNLSVCHWVNG